MSQFQHSSEKHSSLANTYNQNMFKNESYIKRFLNTADGAINIKKVHRTNRTRQAKKHLNSQTARDNKKDNVL